MSTSQKVLHLISSLSRGGRERQLATILKYTEDKAIVFKESSDNQSYIEEYNIKRKIIFLQSKTNFRRLSEIYSIVSNLKPEFLWSWGGLEATFGMIISILKPVVHINGSIRHGIYLGDRGQLLRLIVLHLSKYIVANSHAGLKANMLKRGFVLYNGLDEKFFVEKSEKQNSLPDTLQLKRPVFISVANFVPYKDYITVLLTLLRLKNEGHSFTYLIIGNGPERTIIEQFIRENNLDEHVILLGKISNVLEYLSCADLFIHSSRGEGCSNAILEAMAAGLPVIATSTGGTPEIVHESFGKLFEYKNMDHLYKHLIWFINNPEMFKNMSIKAKEYAKSLFTIEKMLTNYYNILTTISEKIKK